MGKEGGNGTALKIIIPVVVILIGMGVTAGWKLYDNMYEKVEALQEKVGQMAIVVSQTSRDITDIKPKVERTMEDVQETNGRIYRIAVKMGLDDPLGESCQPDSTQWTIRIR